MFFSFYLLLLILHQVPDESKSDAFEKQTLERRQKNGSKNTHLFSVLFGFQNQNIGKRGFKLFPHVIAFFPESFAG